MRPTSLAGMGHGLMSGKSALDQDGQTRSECNFVCMATSQHKSPGDLGSLDTIGGTGKDWALILWVQCAL